MNNTNYMTNSEKLSAFLDGELDSVESESMFFEVGSNPELQEEMRQQVLLTQTMKNNLLIPPVALQDGIYSAIGFSGNLPAAAVPVATFFSRFLGSKVLLVLSSAMIASLITVFFMLNYTSGDAPFNSQMSQNNVRSRMNNTSKNQSAATESRLLPAGVPLSESMSNNESSSRSKSGNAITIASNNNRITLNNKNLAAKDENNEQIIDSDIAKLSQNNEKTTEFIRIGNSPEVVTSAEKFNISAGTRQRLMENFLLAKDYGEFLDKVSLELRFSTAKSFTDINVAPLNEPLLNNFALAILYDLTKNHSVGFELGQENFLQEFDGTENDIPVIWQQNYIAFWAGLAYQYTMNEYSAVQPFGRVILGGSRVGPLAKATLGAKINMTSKMSTFFGWENTALIYQYQSVLFSSLKSGITAGVSIKF